MAKAGKFYDKDGPPEISRPFTAQEHTVLKVEKSCKAASRPYTVMGKRYYPMSGDHTYSQTGVASWYGKQFHGRKTAIGERYDMFAMTAAHPTMELPSYARVTNLSNGKSVIVRVNDRGPFLGDRIIDMSYAAAVKLGYHKAGTARVKVERITRHCRRKLQHNGPEDVFSSCQTNRKAVPQQTNASARETYIRSHRNA